MTCASSEAIGVCCFEGGGDDLDDDFGPLPGDLPDAEGLLALMAQDKKVVDGQLRFILARGIGQAFVTADVPRETVFKLLDDALLAKR